MVEIFEHKEAILKEYLKLEKSIMSIFNEDCACHECPPNKVCCNDSKGLYRGINLIKPWDSYVLDHTFPQWKNYEESREDLDFCSFYDQDVGCVIPEGKPNTCTTHFCDKIYHLIGPYEHMAITTFKSIFANMSLILAEERFGKDIDEEAVLKEIDFYFKEAEQFSKLSERITVPFNYEPVLA